MKKHYILFIFLCSTTLFTYSQKYGRTEFSLGAELGLAASNPYKSDPGNKGFGLGIGASAQIEHYFRESVSGTAYFGFLSYAGRASGPNDNNKAYTAVPIRVGANFYVGDRFFIGGQLGAGLNKISGTSSTTFAYSPQIGYKFSRNNKPLSLTFKYDGYAGRNNFSAIGLRLSFIL